MAINRIRVLVELVSLGLDTCMFFFSGFYLPVASSSSFQAQETPERLTDRAVVATTEKIQAIYRRSPLIRDVSSRSLSVIAVGGGSARNDYNRWRLSFISSYISLDLMISFKVSFILCKLRYFNQLNSNRRLK